VGVGSDGGKSHAGALAGAGRGLILRRSLKGEFLEEQRVGESEGEERK
jgi:hypothetical protein